MSVDPRITVYIASHNYGNFLGNAIESVLQQTIGDWELIIIDDGSTDNTPQVVELYKRHPKISCYRTETIGLPSVCNFALNKSKGKYIIRLDGDDVFDENILLVLGNCLDKDEELALVFPDYYLVDEGGSIFAHERRRKLHINDHLMELPPNGACTLVRTSVLHEVGGYRTDLGAQDGFDLWVKIKDNHKTTNINLPLFFYRRHGKNLTENPLKIINARRELKKDAALNRYEIPRPFIIIIPCRRHYDFVNDLWNELLGERTLLEHDIDACLGLHDIVDHVVVTCDNNEAEQIVLSYNNPKVSFIKRNEKSTIRSSNIVDTLKVVVSKLDPNYTGVSLMRYIQTPFISTETIEEAITSLVVSGSDSVIAIEKMSSRIYKRTAFGLTSINDTLGNLIPEEELYRDSSTCIAFNNSNLLKGSLTGASMAAFPVSAAESFFIDSMHDLEVARSLLAHNSRL